MTIYKSKIKTKDGRQYFFRIKYKDILGEVHDYTSKKYLKRKEAEDEEAIYRTKVIMKETTSSNITLQEMFYDYYGYKSKLLKEPSLIKLKSYYDNYLKFFKNKKINDLTINDYKGFRNYLETFNLSATYKNKIQGTLKCIIEYSAKYYNTSDTILKYFERFKDVGLIKEEMLFYTYEEYCKFIKAVDRFDFKVFFEILYFLGLRQGELQALNWNDINFENKTLSISKTLTSKIKGKKWYISSPKTKNSIRILPIPENVLNDLKTLHNNAMKFKDYNNNWFIFGNAIPFKETNIGVKKNKYAKLAGVKQIRIHDFRHSCASLLINKGASIALVSKYLGHSNISITLNTYTHMFKSELENISNLLNNL